MKQRASLKEIFLQWRNLFLATTTRLEDFTMGSPCTSGTGCQSCDTDGSGFLLRARCTLPTVVVEFKEGDLPEGPPEKIKIPKSRLISMIEGNTFRLEADTSDMLPYQTVFVFCGTN
jgi:hypothetical protein